MARPFTIIDGYNLMHAAGMGRMQYAPGDLEACRIEFLAFLCDRLSRAERQRTTVVFDAANAPAGLEHVATLDEMSVLFSPCGSDADSIIEELIAGHSAPRQILVVSSDHRLQRAARRRRARFVDSEVFYTRLESRRERQTKREETGIPAQKRSGRVSPAELGDWLEIFGDIPGTTNQPSAAERLQREVDQLRDDDD